MNLVPLLKQQLAWTPSTGVNNRGERQFSAVTTVKGRAVPKTRDVIGHDGEVTTVNVQVTMLVEPSMGDLINGREVISAAAIVDITGATVGYLALTR